MDLGDRIKLNFISMTPQEIRVFKYKIEKLPLRARSHSGDSLDLDVELERISGYRGEKYNIGFNLEGGVNYSEIERLAGEEYRVLVARDKDSGAIRLGVMESSSGDIFNFII